MLDRDRLALMDTALSSEKRCPPAIKLIETLGTLLVVQLTSIFPPFTSEFVELIFRGTMGEISDNFQTWKLIHSNLSYPDLRYPGTSLNRAALSTFSQYALSYFQVNY